jgi:hypothetical protein
MKQRSELRRDPEKLAAFHQRGRESSARALNNGSSKAKPARSSFAASDAQRAKRDLHPFCVSCRRPQSEWLTIDPAHLIDRSLGGCDSEDCTVGLCRDFAGNGCHKEYDEGRLDLLPKLEPHFRREVAHAVMHVGLAMAYRRLTNDRTVTA